MSLFTLVVSSDRRAGVGWHIANAPPHRASLIIFLGGPSAAQVWDSLILRFIAEFYLRAQGAQGRHRPCRSEAMSTVRPLLQC